MKRIIFFSDVHATSLNFEIQDASFFDEETLIVGNLEGVLWTEDAEDVRVASPKIRQAKGFEQTVFGSKSMWGLANNHVLDFGTDAAAHTAKVLNSRSFGFNRDVPLAQTASSLLRHKIDGRTVSVIFVNEMMDWLNDSWVSEDGGWVEDAIQFERAEFDSIVVIYYHGGVEGSQLPSTQTRKRFRRFVDLGAYAVLSHHSHVLGMVENYKNAVIDYGMGNFLVNPEKWSKFHSTACFSRVYELLITENRPTLRSDIFEVSQGLVEDSIVVHPVDKTIAERLEDKMSTIALDLNDSFFRDDIQLALGWLYWQTLSRKNISLGIILSLPFFRPLERFFPNTRLSALARKHLISDILGKSSNLMLTIIGYAASKADDQVRLLSALNYLLDKDLVSENFKSAARKKIGARMRLWT